MSYDPLQIPVTGLTPHWICDHTRTDTAPRASSPPPRECAREACGIETIVKSDPALAFHTLRLVNSSFAGLRGKVSTLSHAIAVLGRRSLRQLAIGALARLDAAANGASGHSNGASGHSNGASEPTNDEAEFFAHSLHVAHAARSLAELVGYDLPEEAYVTGLLHDTGIHLRSPANGSRRASDARNGSRRAAARRAGSLARSAQLPRGLAAAITRHLDPVTRLEGLAQRTRQLTLITAAADALVHESLGDRADYRSAPDAYLNELELDRERAESAMASAADSLLTATAALGSTFATIQDFRSGASVSDAQSFQPAIIDDLRTRGHSIPSLNRISRELLAKGSWVEVLEAVVHLLQSEVGFDRVMYLERNRAGGKLTLARLGDETHLNPPIDEWTVTLGKNEQCLTRSVKQREALITRDTSADAGLLPYFGAREMAIAPIIVKKQTVGVLTADQYVRGIPLTDADLGALEMLAQKTGLLLEKLELETQGRKLRKIAEKDALTGINNRRCCIDLCRKEIERARRYSAPLSVVLIDIDNFKDFNDTYGHAAGDRVLRDLARLVESNSRRTDVIGRFGGDEFLAILPQISRDQAITYAERLRLRTSDLGRAITKRYPRCHLAISLGVATWTKGSRIDDVIAAADKALYAAKDRGRNRVCTTD